MDKIVYFDNNATTKVAPEVVEAMIPFLSQYYGNPSSMHSFGGQVAYHVQEARENVATLLGTTPEEIIFTSCGSESDNTAIFGSLAALEKTAPERHQIVTSNVEHPAVRNTLAHFSRKGYQVLELQVDEQGLLNLEQAKQVISSKTALVSIMHANNETGVLFPVEEIAQIAKQHGAIMHVDAVQSVTKEPIDLKNSVIDLLALSGHKIHAPKGVGALYIRKGTLVRPLILGGHQEHGQRAGTEAVPNIIALGAAAKLAMLRKDTELEKIKAMRDDLENWILTNIPHTHVNGHRTKRVVNTSNIGFDYIEGESILLELNKIGICASSGSACSSGSLEPSHVLRAMHVPFTSLHGSIRFSLSYNNTQDEIEYTKANLGQIVQRLREISPYSEKYFPMQS
ncbi:MAG: cysteine desulfurase NifS [Planctomycetes bacterium]|jgi:cysteine desulfurase|nr:cysteine desulfurase NifS [Planctomycetota bacterium]